MTSDFDFDAPGIPETVTAPTPSARPQKKASRRPRQAAGGTHTKQSVQAVLETAEVVRGWSDGTRELAETALSLPANGRDDAAVVFALLGRQAAEFRQLVEAVEQLLEHDGDIERMAVVHDARDDVRAAMWRGLDACGIVSGSRPADAFSVAMAVVKGLKDRDTSDLASRFDELAAAI